MWTTSLSFLKPIPFVCVACQLAQMINTANQSHIQRFPMQNQVCLCDFNPLEIRHHYGCCLTSGLEDGIDLFIPPVLLLHFIPVTRLTSCSLRHFGLGLEPHQKFDRNAWAFTSLADLAAAFLWVLSIQWRHSGLRLGHSCRHSMCNSEKFTNSRVPRAICHFWMRHVFLPCHAVPDIFFAGCALAPNKTWNVTYCILKEFERGPSTTWCRNGHHWQRWGGILR